MTLDEMLQVQAFELGFQHGARADRARRRHTVEPATHASWKRGYEAGVKAFDAARMAFRLEVQKRRPEYRLTESTASPTGTSGGAP